MQTISQKGISLLLLILIIGITLIVSLYIYTQRNSSVVAPDQTIQKNTFIPLSPDELSKKVDENSKKGGVLTLEYMKEQMNTYSHLQEALLEPEKVYILYIWNRPGLQLSSSENANLTVLPDEIAKLQNLYKLDIENVPISSLNPKISDLKNLQILELSDLPLTVFPESILSLSNLRELSLTGTKITSLPRGINQLKNLKKFEFRESPIEVLPKEVGELINLEELNIMSTKITSLPPEITNLKSLKNLYVVNTPLSQEQINQIKKALPNTAVWTSLPGD